MYCSSSLSSVCTCTQYFEMDSSILNLYHVSRLLSAYTIEVVLCHDWYFNWDTTVRILKTWLDFWSILAGLVLLPPKIQKNLLRHETRHWFEVLISNKLFRNAWNDKLTCSLVLSVARCRFLNLFLLFMFVCYYQRTGRTNIIGQTKFLCARNANWYDMIISVVLLFRRNWLAWKKKKKSRHAKRVEQWRP